MSTRQTPIVRSALIAIIVSMRRPKHKKHLLLFFICFSISCSCSPFCRNCCACSRIWRMSSAVCASIVQSVTNQLFSFFCKFMHDNRGKAIFSRLSSVSFPWHETFWWCTSTKNQNKADPIAGVSDEIMKYAMTIVAQDARSRRLGKLSIMIVAQSWSTVCSVECVMSRSSWFSSSAGESERHFCLFFIFFFSLLLISCEKFNLINSNFSAHRHFKHATHSLLYAVSSLRNSLLIFSFSHFDFFHFIISSAVVKSHFHCYFFVRFSLSRMWAFSLFFIVSTISWVFWNREKKTPKISRIYWA